MAKFKLKIGYFQAGINNLTTPSVKERVSKILSLAKKHQLDIVIMSQVTDQIIEHGYEVFFEKGQSSDELGITIFCKNRDDLSFTVDSSKNKKNVGFYGAMELVVTARLNDGESLSEKTISIVPLYLQSRVDTLGKLHISVLANEIDKLPLIERGLYLGAFNSTPETLLKSIALVANDARKSILESMSIVSSAERTFVGETLLRKIVGIILYGNRPTHYALVSGDIGVTCQEYFCLGFGDAKALIYEIVF